MSKHNQFTIDADIRRANTLPSSFYKDKTIFEAIKEKVFLNSWQFVGDESLLKNNKIRSPFCSVRELLDRTNVAHQR